MVLVDAAHADDEALGCSGTIAKHIANGDNVHLLLMTDGVSARSGIKDSKKRLAPHSRNLENILRLNVLRGNSIGVSYAEAFMAVRILK
ncbi:PIG-L family deacetylase [Candidatus Pseudothioglobus singularis]|nr:PIG-L family deacetylase [Candidatus Pseudothioglobus singularis]